MTGLANDFPQDIGDGSNTTSPVLLYRHMLASSPDNSITIANIGFHDNLYHLLHSLPDKISPLSGPNLIKKKVVEHVVQGNPNGTSFNFEGDDPKYAQYVLTHWPGRITYIPDAIGSTIYFGSRLTTELNVTTNPVAYAAATSIGIGEVHQTWDCKLLSFLIPESLTNGNLFMQQRRSTMRYEVLMTYMESREVGVRSRFLRMERRSGTTILDQGCSDQLISRSTTLHSQHDWKTS